MTGPYSNRSGLYYPKLPATWWLRRPAYFRFMMRELSSVFIAVFLVVLLIELYQLAQGPAAYAAFVATLRSPGWLAFHVVALAFALYHSVTWLALTAVVQVVRLGEHEIPPRLITAVSFVLWGLISMAILLWFILRS